MKKHTLPQWWIGGIVVVVILVSTGLWLHRTYLATTPPAPETGGAASATPLVSATPTTTVSAGVTWFKAPQKLSTDLKLLHDTDADEPGTFTYYKIGSDNAHDIFEVIGTSIDPS